MLHMKFKIHGCSGLRELVIRMDLNTRVDVNCGWADGRTENPTPISHLAKAGATKRWKLISRHCVRACVCVGGMSGGRCYNGLTMYCLTFINRQTVETQARCCKTRCLASGYFSLKYYKNDKIQLS